MEGGCLRGRDTAAEPQESRTEFQPRALGAAGIDLEAHFVPFHGETDGTALTRELLRLADEENAYALECGDKFGNVATFGLGDENDLAATHVFRAPPAPNHDFATRHGLPFHDFLQRTAERIVAQNANGEWRSGIDKRRRRPFHELREVREERRLHIVFGVLRARERRERAAEGEHDYGARVPRSSQAAKFAPDVGGRRSQDDLFTCQWIG